MRLIRRIVSEAAWPGIAVLVAHGVFGELLGHEPYVDPAMHWELGEFLSDVLVGTHIQRSVGNTMRDLFNGLLGAGLFIAGDIIVRRTLTPKSRLQRAAGPERA